MPYNDEKAGKTGHIPITKLLTSEELQNLKTVAMPETKLNWTDVQFTSDTFEKVVVCDSGPATAVAQSWPYQSLTYFNTVVLTLDTDQILSSDPFKDPRELLDYIDSNLIRISAIVPIRNIIHPDLSFQETFRLKVWNIFENYPELLQTLHWLVFQDHSSVTITCPECEKRTTIYSKSNVTTCIDCSRTIYLSDFLSLHIDLSETSARETAISSLMNNIETLCLFSKIRQLWQSDKQLLAKHLFIKDGPLFFPAPFNKLVLPIRKFLARAIDNETPVFLISQEKNGTFASYLDMIKNDSRMFSYLILDDHFIHSEIQQMRKWNYLYGMHTHYGCKIFLTGNTNNHLVLNIATPRLYDKPNESNFPSFDRIVNTVLRIRSFQYKSALLPIQLAHKYASISNYPGSSILQKITQETLRWDL
tara:strand:- start:141 stop:1397 length:1257 start_codon:yes stop_codon:yes gene_type:complete